MLTDESIILNLNDVVRITPEIADTTELEFTTPTSILVDGKWTDALTFEHLIRNLLRGHHTAFGYGQYLLSSS